MDVFKRPRDFDDRALGVSLRPYEWEVLLALDGRTPLIQLLHRMHLAELDADEVADELAGKGLMIQCVVTFGEFMRERTHESGLPPTTPPPPPSISFKEAADVPALNPTVASSAANPPVASPPATPPASPAVTPQAKPVGPTSVAALPPLPASPATTLPSASAAAKPGTPAPPSVAMKPPPSPPKPVDKPPISAIIKPPPPRLSFSVKPEREQRPGGPSAKPANATPQVAVGISGYKLKPLFDFIVDKAGGNALPKIAAQLAVYRVFRRVPRELMVADNIHSFSIGDPTIEVHNKQLYDAIVRAIEATFGVKYDASEADRAAG